MHPSPPKVSLIDKKLKYIKVISFHNAKMTETSSNDGNRDNSHQDPIINAKLYIFYYEHNK